MKTIAVPVERSFTQEWLKSYLLYDPDTGIFTRRTSSHGHNAGDVAGCHNTDGYILLKIHDRSYSAARVAWFYMTGEWPKIQMDHKNRIRDDNRWANIREATVSENGQNIGLSKRNKSGFVGVIWSGRNKKWAAQIRANGRKHYLGLFTDKEVARAAYLSAKKVLHPFNPIGG